MKEKLTGFRHLGGPPVALPRVVVLLLCIVVASSAVVPLWILVMTDSTDRFKRYDMIRWARELKELNPGLVMPELPRVAPERD